MATIVEVSAKRFFVLENVAYVEPDSGIDNYLVCMNNGRCLSLSNKEGEELIKRLHNLSTIRLTVQQEDNETYRALARFFEK